METSDKWKSDSLRDPNEILAAIDIWFFRDLGETMRRQLINLCGFPGIEANGAALQRRLLNEILTALSRTQACTVSHPTPPTIDAPERREAALGRVRAALALGEHVESLAASVLLSDLRALLAASSGERGAALEEAAEIVAGVRSRCGVETLTDRARRQTLTIAEERIRALATPATVEEPKV